MEANVPRNGLKKGPKKVGGNMGGEREMYVGDNLI